MSYIEDDRPGASLLIVTVLIPLLAVAVELATRLCADTFFDPVPTWGHVALVLAVPATNLLLWRAGRGEGTARPWLLVAAGAAGAVAATYALMMLPLFPIALVAIVLIGVGFLPMAPAFALIGLFKLTARLPDLGVRGWPRVLGGAGLGLLALTVVDLPASATFLALRWAGGDEESVRRGVGLMRGLGDESLLLRLCYGEGRNAIGLVGAFSSMGQSGMFSGPPPSDPASARELYYRVTGTPFNAVARPSELRSRGFDGFGPSFDDDQGGQSVAGRAEGLELADSRLDGSVSAADNLAYLEWTARFRNRAEMQREARLTLALPPGAVASRATLWVDGEPREASVAGRGEARAAYESTVRVSRDPLLVTTGGAGRLLVQAFPVQPHAELQLRIGITAPLAIAADGRRSLALPALADRNFEIPAALRHQVWIESRDPLAARGAAFQVRNPGPGTTMMRAALTNGELAARPRIWTTRLTGPASRVALAPPVVKAPPLAILQTVAEAASERPHALTLLLDGSAGNAAAGKALAHALDALPADLPVALVIASEKGRAVPAAPWGARQRALFEEALGRTDFEGGQDNVAALADALEGTAGGGDVLLWIHGPQPIDFFRSRGRLDQLLERRPDLPRLVRYQSRPGPTWSVAGNAWFDTAREAVPSGDPAADLAAILRTLSGGAPAWRVVRTLAPAGAAATGSPHIARLWGADRLAGAGRTEGADRERAIALARRLNIVTPVSGAVVLATDSEYQRNGLAVPGAADVPTVPEPETWALLLLVALALLWLARRRRMAGAFA
jgi:hypothetical protein